MKRVLLTGATGFIGRHCLPLLVERGYEVHAVSSRTTPADQPNLYWHRADMLDSGQVGAVIDDIKPMYLLHFSWYAVLGKFWTSPDNFRWVQASLELLQKFAREGGRRAVMAGTCAEYDWRYGFCSETVTPLFPTTLYGICKHSLQLMLGSFSKHMGLSAAWGRIFFLFGPHEHPDRLVAYVIRSLLRGEPARCSHGNQIRDFLYVQDVAEAFVALLESTVSGPVNIASGKPVALRDVINTIAKIQNRPDLIELGIMPTREDEPQLLLADVRRLREEVGWKPKYDLETALRKTIKWWSQRSEVA